MAQLPGTILTARFVSPGNKLFSGFIDYMDRNEAVRNQYQAKWNLFTTQNEAQGSAASETMASEKIEMNHDDVVADYEGFNDYMGDKRKNGGLFTATKDTLTDNDVSQVKHYYREAQRAGSPLWQLVFSFDNAWLKEAGLLDPDTGYLDTSKIQTATRNAIQTLERQTGLQGLWTASLHYNTDNLHVHIGYVERQPTRKWIYYENTKQPELSGWQYKGTVSQKALDQTKSRFTNTLASQKALLMALDQTLKQTITQARATQWQSKTYQAAVTQLMDQLPENKRYWQYGYAKGQHFKGALDQVINLFLRTDGQALTEEISQQLKALDEKYKRNYGQTKSSYRENKLFGKNGLYARLGNLILRDVKANGRQLTAEDKTQKSVALDYEALAKQLTAVSQEAMAKVRQTQEPMKAAAKVQLAETTKAALNHALTAKEKNTIMRAYQERVKPLQPTPKQQVGLAYSAKEKNIVHYDSTQERDAIFRENKAENFDTAPLMREMNQIAPAINTQPRRTEQNRLSWQERRTRRQAYYAKRQGSYDNSLNQLRRYLKQSSQEYLNEQKYEAIEKQATYREEHQKTL